MPLPPSTRLRRLNLSVVWMLLFLERTPALRIVAGSTDYVASSRVVSLLKAAFASASSLGAVHTVVVSNLAGIVASSAATLTVTAGGPVIAAHPQSQYVAPGTTASFTVSATGIGYSGLAVHSPIRVSTSGFVGQGDQALLGGDL